MPFLTLFVGKGSPKIDYREGGTLILTTYFWFALGFWFPLIWFGFLKGVDSVSFASFG